MRVWNVLRAARWKCRTQKIATNWPSGHHRTTLSGYIFATKARIDNRKKSLLSSNTSSICPCYMVNFGPLTAEIVSLVWGTPANLNGFRVLAALLHGTLVVGVSQTLRRWKEGATYMRQGNYHVEQWPTFLVVIFVVNCYCLLVRTLTTILSVYSVAYSDRASCGWDRWRRTMVGLWNNRPVKTTRRGKTTSPTPRWTATKHNATTAATLCRKQSK